MDGTPHHQALPPLNTVAKIKSAGSNSSSPQPTKHHRQHGHDEPQAQVNELPLINPTQVAWTMDAAMVRPSTEQSTSDRTANEPGAPSDRPQGCTEMRDAKSLCGCGVPRVHGHQLKEWHPPGLGHHWYYRGRLRRWGSFRLQTLPSPLERPGQRLADSHSIHERVCWNIYSCNTKLVMHAQISGCATTGLAGVHMSATQQQQMIVMGITMVRSLFVITLI